MRRTVLIIIVLGVIAALAIREVHLHRKPPLERAYVSASDVSVWNSTAEVRAPVATLSYGEAVQVLERAGDQVLIGGAAGVRGWISSRLLMTVAVWREASQLDKTAKSMPVQARGHTRVRSNVHTLPGRQWPVILEAPGDTSVDMLERRAVPNLERRGSRSSAPNLEDWWLVRANVKNLGEVSGWLLSRSVDLDLPEPLAEYESSEDITIVAWFEINRSVDSTGAVQPEYLVMGTRQGEGRPCDFTLIRVYTWSPVRHLYETAFMERGLCGSLPVKVAPAAAPGGKAYFGFRNIGLQGWENRQYEMKLTTVRRIDAGASAARKAKKH